jgi:hypothetical protein
MPPIQRPKQPESRLKLVVVDEETHSKIVGEQNWIRGLPEKQFWNLVFALVCGMCIGAVFLLAVLSTMPTSTILEILRR